MKKSLLALIFMFSISFVIGGVNDAKAAPLKNNIRFEQSKDFAIGRSKNFLRTEFRKKYSELDRLCKNYRGPACNAALGVATAASVIAWGICTQSPESCVDAQEWALGVLDWATNVCRNDPIDGVEVVPSVDVSKIVEFVEERKRNLKTEVSAVLNKRQTIERNSCWN